MKRTAGLVIVVATVVLAAAGFAVFGMAGSSSPELGPGVVVPSSPSGAPPSAPDPEGGATPVSPPAPPDAGDDDDDDDDFDD